MVVIFPHCESQDELGNKELHERAEPVGTEGTLGLSLMQSLNISKEGNDMCQVMLQFPT